MRLQEDVTLAGFTPLKNYQPDPVFCRSNIDIEIAQVNNLLIVLLIFIKKSICCLTERPSLTKADFLCKKYTM